MSFPPSVWVLVIEGLQDQAFWSDVCVDAGVNVMTAATSVQGYQRACASQPALILVDQALPDIDGWALCRLLKADDRTKAIPIVILMADDEPHGDARAQEAGCAAHLTRACPPADLLAVLRKVLADQQAV